MPRSISWQPRLRDIERQVRDSARTPYTREDIERLFKIKKVAALDLVKMMPRTTQGNTSVIERENLLAWLTKCLAAANLSAHLDELRKRPPEPSRRRLKIYVPREFEFGNLMKRDMLGIRLQRNEAVITFTDRADYASKVYQMISLLDDPDFERRYCTPAIPTKQELENAAEVKLIRAGNRLLAKTAAIENALLAGEPEIADLFRAEAEAARLEVDELCEQLGRAPDEYHERAALMLATLFPESQNLTKSENQTSLGSAGAPICASVPPSTNVS